MAREKIRGIYCIENVVNYKKYIGQSNNIYSRWENHKWCLNNNKHDNSYLQRAWNKYGEEKFSFTILEICDEDVIDEYEKYFIDFYSTLIDSNGYNLDSGGNLNKKHSEITKNKISKAHIGKKLSDETKAKISTNRKGKLVGEEHFMYGRHHSEETKKKLSEALTGMFSYEKHYEATSVICLNTNKIFTTMKSAGEFYDTNPFNISKCCRGERKSSGVLADGTPLQWDYYEEGKNYELKKYKKDTNAKPVFQYDLNENYIATYESAREAEKQTGIGYKMISRVCNGHRSNTHGYIFRFAS